MHIKICNLKILIIPILLLSSSVFSAEEENQHKLLNAWVYRVYTSDITRNKFSSVFDLNKTGLYSEIKITPSTNVDTLLKDCSTEKYDIVIAPENIAKLLKDNCDYETTLFSIENLKIYVKKRLPRQTVNELKTIGIVENSPESLFIYEEMSKLNANWDVKEYSSGGEIFFSLLRDEIDGIVIVESFMNSTDPFIVEKIEEIYSLGTKELHALVPNKLMKEKRDFIEDSIMSNSNKFLSSRFKKH